MYVIDWDKLRAGDIILTRLDSEISKHIRRLTKSEYSHAILYVGVGSCIESDGYGVQSQNIQRLLFENIDDVKILRLKNAEAFKNIDDVIVYARQKIGTEYSIDEAKLSILKKELKSKKQNRQFCTRFIAQAYNNSDIELVKNPDYCTPKDIQESKILTEISNPLRVANQIEIKFAKSESPIKKQAEIHNYIFQHSRNISNEDIQTFEQLSKYVSKHPEKEPAITQVIKDSGYLTMWKMDIENNPWHYDVNKFIEYYSNPIVANQTAHFFATTEYVTRERFIITLNALRYGYQFYKHEYWQIQIKLYEKLVELSLKRENIGKQIFHIFNPGYKIAIFKILEIDFDILPNEITLLDIEINLPVIIDLSENEIEIVNKNILKEGDTIIAIIKSQLNEYGETAVWNLISIEKKYSDNL